MISDIKDKLDPLTTIDVKDFDKKQAGILIYIKQNDQGIPIDLIYTLRSSNMTTHAGEVSFPGGMQDERDLNLAETAIRETQEETLADIKIIQPYTMISLPHINQVHMFYLADLPNATFGTTIESSEVKLLALEEIPWEEVAFPTVKLTLKFYQDDLSKNTFTFREDQILLS